MTGWWIGYTAVMLSALALAGFAWQDALRGRLRLAPYFALLLLSAGAWVGATFAGTVHFSVIALAACVPIGLALRSMWPRTAPGAPPLRRSLDIGIGLLYGVAGSFLAIAWSAPVRNWGYLILILLILARLGGLDRLRGRTEAEPGE